ncbi:MAG: hypothetical protein ABI670_04980 [Chloroflexota bacterium]
MQGISAQEVADNMQAEAKDNIVTRAARGMSVAIIGPDGAGKSTLVQRLHQAGTLPTAIVYMGGNAATANYTLPTTRWFTNRWLAKNGGLPGKPGAISVSRESKQVSPLKRVASGAISVVRLGHELLEYTYRFIVAYSARRRGAVVLYDRYIYDPLIDAMADNPSRWYWFRAELFRRIFPRPDILIVLEAPGTLLFERKGEHDPGRLDRVRAACREIAQSFDSVTYIDATQPPDDVAEKALAFINKNRSSRP